jgi:hypothetical protein
VMFHFVIPTVLKNIILWKLSDVQMWTNSTKINHFRKVRKFVLLIFSQNKPVPKGLIIWNANPKLMFHVSWNFIKGKLQREIRNVVHSFV